MRATTDERLRQLCELGIASCRARDADEVREVFVQLIGALDFEYRVAAARLFRIYQECIRCARRREFCLPMLVLEWLRAPSALPAAAPHRRSTE
jgi:hypothetical protein